jgi:hypothetical protein
MTRKQQAAQTEPWWMTASSLNGGLLDRYGLNGERYPVCWGFDLTPRLAASTSRPPAVLWVAVGRRMGLTTLVLDDYSSRGVLRMDVYRDGVRDVRVVAREDGQLMGADDLRALSLGATLADLAVLGDLVLEELQAHLDSGGELDDWRVVSIEGSASDALTHLLGLLERRRGSVDLRLRVVELYRRAVRGDLGEPAKRAPRKAVARQVGYSDAYVGRLLVEARELGLLEKTTPGRKNAPEEGS